MRLTYLVVLCAALAIRALALPAISSAADEPALLADRVVAKQKYGDVRFAITESTPASRWGYIPESVLAVYDSGHVIFRTAVATKRSLGRYAEIRISPERLRAIETRIRISKFLKVDDEIEVSGWDHPTCYVLTYHSPAASKVVCIDGEVLNDPATLKAYGSNPFDIDEERSKLPAVARRFIDELLALTKHPEATEWRPEQAGVVLWPSYKQTEQEGSMAWPMGWRKPPHSHDPRDPSPTLHVCYDDPHTLERIQQAGLLRCDDRQLEVWITIQLPRQNEIRAMTERAIAASIERDERKAAKP